MVVVIAVVVGMVMAEGGGRDRMRMPYPHTPIYYIHTSTTTTTRPLAMSYLPEKVSVAPLVLLSVVDHYNRTSTSGKNRVVGAILGERVSDVNSGGGGVVRVTNSFAVPFEEDARNPDVWYLDHNYIEGMQDMFKKINAKEKLIGWYHSGPRLRSADMAINEVLKRFCPHPMLLIVDVNPEKVGIPTDAYFAVDEVKADGSSAGRTFYHVPGEIRAEDAEEIGVEHLLRDVRNAAAGTLATRISQQLSSLKGLSGRLQGIAAYLDRVLKGELPVNHEILGELQNVFNLLPNLSASQNAVLERAFTTNANDQLMIVYLSSMVRAVVAFHDMIDNKIQNKKKLGLLDQEKEVKPKKKNDEPEPVNAN